MEEAAADEEIAAAIDDSHQHDKSENRMNASAFLASIGRGLKQKDAKIFDQRNHHRNPNKRASTASFSCHPPGF